MTLAGEWVNRSRFWHPGISPSPPIAMMTLYCDESDDGETYALAGWFAPPSAWDLFDPAWKEMLKGITMPDGSPCPAFHAAEIVGRDEISDSRFCGWTFKDEVAAFTKATDLIVDPTKCAIMWPVGCAVEIPATFKWVPRDSIWLLLFMKLFDLLLETYRPQQGISFMFDIKPEVADFALRYYRQLKDAVDKSNPDKFASSSIAFGDDEEVMPLQAADFLAYEWRKRISDSRHRPDKAARRSYTRIREARHQGALWRYGREVFEQALNHDDQTQAWMDALVDQRPTHYD